MSVIVPLGGNAFITTPNNVDWDKIQDTGLKNWDGTGEVCSIFFKLSQAEVFTLSLVLRVIDNFSFIKVSCQGQSFDKKIQGSAFHQEVIGTFRTNGGYTRIDIRGLNKTGRYYGDIVDVVLNGIKGQVTFVKRPDDFYWGRRGPSTHLSYGTPQPNGVEYFYDEVTVEKGNDQIGSYFATICFDGGYFGIQVNSHAERRILFSIWSPHDTDNPEDIPEHLRVKLKRKGQGVIIDSFGNEGSGAKSHLKFMWRAGETYRFIVRAEPTNSQSTIFTAWFSPTVGNWRLISSFERPTVASYLTGLYSFSENFLTQEGFKDRKVYFGNQWGWTKANGWKEITRAQFTSDATSDNGRLDYAGGVENDKFFLRNIGFFNEQVRKNQHFNRPPTNRKPVVDLNKLP